MITEIVLFRLPDGMSREEAIAKYRLSVPGWRANPDLIRKTFLFDETSRRGGAVYNWKSIEAAKLGHGGQEYIARLFAIDPKTVRRGMDELDHLPDDDPQRVRKKGGDAGR